MIVIDWGSCRNLKKKQTATKNDGEHLELVPTEMSHGFLKLPKNFRPKRH